MTTIESGAFSNCDNLTSVTIPDSVTSIGEDAFNGCQNLASVTIPNSVTSIGTGAFYFCTSLPNIAIPNSVTTIEASTFSYCLSLISVTIPDSITTIERFAFQWCDSLKDVYYSGSESQWEQIDINNLINANDPLLGATIHYNSTAPTPSPTPGGTTGSGTSSGSGGSSNSTSSSTVGTPSTSMGSGTATVNVSASSTTSGSTASATVNSTNMNNAVNSAMTEAAKQGTAPVVEIKVNTSSRADSLNVTLPAASLETLAGAEASSLVISSDIIEVALDHTALDALAGQTTGSTVTLEVVPVANSALSAAQKEVVDGAIVVDLSMASNGVVIHNYNGGKITVSLPYTLAEGESAADVVVYYLDDGGSLTPCDTSYADSKVTFITTHLSKYVIGTKDLLPEESEFAEVMNPFVDVAESDWFYEFVAYVAQNGLMSGVGNGQFNPGGTTTRGMIMTILARQDGLDTSGSSPWYQMGMEWAMRVGVSDGTGPEADITREQLATMLWRYAGEPVSTGDLSGYPDAGDVHDWASNAMIWAVQNGIINGSNGKLNPQGNALRSEAAAMLTRYCKNIER